MKNGRIIGVFAFMVLIVFGLWYALSWMQQSTQEQQTLEPSGNGVIGVAGRDEDPFDVTITYTDEGYVPREISIRKGTRVRFLNNASDPTWPASGVHPTHSLYPEKQPTDCLGSSFDSCRGLKKGEFYDYTFYYVGEWPYHDHLHAYHSGFIVVAE